MNIQLVTFLLKHTPIKWDNPYAIVCSCDSDPWKTMTSLGYDNEVADPYYPMHLYEVLEKEYYNQDLR